MESEEENEDDAGQNSPAEESSQEHSSSDLDETELEDTIIDTSISASIDVDLSQFESEIYEYFVPEDARAKLLTMYMANKQKKEKKSLEHKGSSSTKFYGEGSTKSSSEEPVRQHIDQIGEDDAKIYQYLYTSIILADSSRDYFRNDSELIFHIGSN